MLWMPLSFLFAFINHPFCTIFKFYRCYFNSIFLLHSIPVLFVFTFAPDFFSMSDPIRHECGIALVRLLKPLSYYQEKYGTLFYGLNKLYLLMEKQHNRGQDGAGVATIKLDSLPGKKYIDRVRSTESQPLKHIFDLVFTRVAALQKENPDHFINADWVKNNVLFAGEILMGHLRYATHGSSIMEYCHPVYRTNNWITRNLLMAGNFNLTNTDELFELLIDLGQQPKEKSDTVTVLEKFGHFLDLQVQELFSKFNKEGHTNRAITEKIIEELDVLKIITKSTEDFDGGYAILGMIGHGDVFLLRDPNGIRPAYYYIDDEVIVAASERPAIQTAFNVDGTKVMELKPAQALIIKKDGSYKIGNYRQEGEKKSCSFERIYFSRGTDKDIYQERTNLGYQLTDRVLKAINYDITNTVFSFIPNTAELCFLGLVKGIEDSLLEQKKHWIKTNYATAGDQELDRILSIRPRVEKIAIKDAKLRTFITDDRAREELVSHVYDISYGAVRSGKDNLVIVDDSIVRGTTLRKSILAILDRLGPKKIIVVSSAPQIRYPDCYGIDMSIIQDFVAFNAMVALTKDRKNESLFQEIYERCKIENTKPKLMVRNLVKILYDQFADAEISAKITELVRPAGITAEVEVIFQSITGLHCACPGHKGDWYFTGHYPTPGGNKVVNQSFINYMEGRYERSY